MTEPKVSIIVPIYNTGRYLRQCVDSLLAQTLQDFEIILVDDESPDDAPRICDEYARQDSRIKVVHKKNGGLGYARNSGLDVAMGEYVSFIDSDDFVSPEMMETLYRTAKEYDADEVRSGTVFYNNGKTTQRRDVDQVTVFRGKEDVKQFVFDLLGPLPEEGRDVKYMMSVCLALHRRAVIEEHHVRFTSERETLSEDLIFDLDLFPKMNCIVCIPDCFYHYRMNPNSLTHTFSMEKYKRYRMFFELVERKMDGIAPYEEYGLHYLRLKFLYLRNVLSSVAKSSESYSVRRKNVEKVLSESTWKDLLNSYPYKSLGMKHRVYFSVINKKHPLSIIIVNRYLM